MVTTLEHIRQAGEQYVAAQLAAASSSPAKQGEVLGASTYDPGAQTTAAASSGNALGTIWRGILTGLLYVFKLQLLFYLALLFVLYVLYKIVQGFFRYRRRA